VVLLDYNEESGLNEISIEDLTRVAEQSLYIFLEMSLNDLDILVESWNNY
jgi:hypothetical protein